MDSKQADELLRILGDIYKSLARIERNTGELARVARDQHPELFKKPAPSQIPETSDRDPK